MIVFKNYYTPYLYIFLYIIYTFQGVLYESSGLISKSILFVLMISSSFFFIKSFLIKKKKDLFYKSWTFMLFLNVIIYIFTLAFTEINEFQMFKNVVTLFLGFYPFYFWSYKKIIPQNFFKHFFYLLLISSIVNFYFWEFKLSFYRNAEVFSVVNNMSYQFVYLIPYLFFIRKKLVLKFLYAIVLLFYIIQGAKRGAIITGSIGLITYFYFLFKTSKLAKSYRYIIFLILIGGFSYYAYYEFSQNEFLVNRMQSLSGGNTSGRTHIYKNIMMNWFDSNSLFHYIFGFGFGGSVVLSGDGHFAHNDWLELLSNLGLLGLMSYFMLFYANIKTYRKKIVDINKNQILLIVFLLWFITSLFSMWYTNLSCITQSILLGYLYGNTNKKAKFN